MQKLIEYLVGFPSGEVTSDRSGRAGQLERTQRLTLSLAPNAAAERRARNDLMERTITRRSARDAESVSTDPGS